MLKVEDGLEGSRQWLAENDAENDAKNESENGAENDTKNETENDAENESENESENGAEDEKPAKKGLKVMQNIFAVEYGAENDFAAEPNLDRLNHFYILAYYYV